MKDNCEGGLQFSADAVMSPFTKFELETSKNDKKFVHIKCCYNNKYWITFSPNLKSIQPLADEPDEDRSEWSCTLFEFIYDADLQAYRIRHVKLGCYLIPHTGPIAATYTLYAGVDTPDADHHDVFTVTDFRSLLPMPKHVAFKGDNGCYLRAAMQEHHEYLEFSSTSIGDDKAGYEVVVNDDGTICIKSKFFGKFWRLSPSWIWLIRPMQARAIPILAFGLTNTLKTTRLH
ncbi:uncharacterized protein LOC111014653 [Momordica charantia]|uniref:Uncharacterized protein LOC111014653 n=1 Tax=Momordica charantia TaxID=3673 RepID=A0A6J1CVG1_MOMCH|nr:uncharacterized protein LOC111014653 [Momordica charantia]